MSTMFTIFPGPDVIATAMTATSRMAVTMSQQLNLPSKRIDLDVEMLQ